MRPADEYHRMRLLLIEMLREPDDPPVVLTNDAKQRLEEQRDFMVATTAHTIAVYTTCFMADFEAAEAWRGVEAMHATTREVVYDICDEEIPT